MQKVQKVNAPTAGEMVAFLRTVPPSTAVNLGDVVYDGVAVSTIQPAPKRKVLAPPQPKRSRRSKKSD